MIHLYTVNTFTTALAGGNPAAVCLMGADETREEAWYGQVAALLAQPATAFCRPVDGGFSLRWFSPSQELTLCGHGTLAATHVLYETGAVPGHQKALLSTMTTDLQVRREAGRSWMALPSVSLVEEAVPAEVLSALRLTGVVDFARGDDELVVQLDSAEAVEQVKPDFRLLALLPVTRTVVTAAGGEGGVDFTSRVFPPRIGVAEDQVTGSAHAALGPYWAARLRKGRLLARQASVRGGMLTLDVSRSDTVHIGGHAVLTSSGLLLA